jgi:ABC-type Fe3+ transport system permease subunit
MTNLPPPNANERVDFPIPEIAPAPATVPTPALESNPVQAPSSVAKRPSKPTDPVVSLVVSIAAFFFCALPFIGLALGAFGVYLGIRGLGNNPIKRKSFIWSIVLAGLGGFAALSYTTSFITFMSNR